MFIIHHEIIGTLFILQDAPFKGENEKSLLLAVRLCYAQRLYYRFQCLPEAKMVVRNSVLRGDAQSGPWVLPSDKGLRAVQ